MLPFIILFFISVPTFATINIPSGLSTNEQQLLLQTFGFGTSFRPVDNPYPLGGYSGLEVGVSVQSLPTSDIGYYGNRTTVDRNVIYPLISVGKGIFDSIDFLLSFIPYNESTGIGVYSGAIRWSFYQAAFVPTNFSLLLFGGNTNLNNIFISQTVGADIITGVNVEPVSFYFGIGTLYGQAQFSSTLTADNTPTNQTGRTFHTMLGVNLALAEFFSALEVDTYNSTIVSVKLGLKL